MFTSVHKQNSFNATNVFKSYFILLLIFFYCFIQV